MKDDTTTVEALKELVNRFCTERDWRKYNSPKSLAISISLEAAELLEHFQWENALKQDKEAIADEVSDVLFNLLNFADVMEIDITTAFIKKFEKLEKKYPVELFNSKRNSEKDYQRIKKEYREKS